MIPVLTIILIYRFAFLSLRRIRSRICIYIKLVRFPEMNPEQSSLEQPKNTEQGKKISD